MQTGNRRRAFLSFGLLALLVLSALSHRAEALNTGDKVTFTGQWQDEKKNNYPMHGVQIVIHDSAATGGTPDIQGVLVHGSFTFTVPRNGYTYDVILTASFPGVDASGDLAPAGGAGAFEVRNPATNDVHSEPAGSNIVTYTSPKGGTSILEMGDVWAAYHGMADMVREARRRLGIEKAKFVLNFPENGSFFDPTNKNISLLLRDRYDWDVVAHEFGHSVSDETQAVTSLAGGPHDGSNQYTFPSNSFTRNNKPRSIGLAFNEGFGTWFGGALLEQSDYRGKFPRVGDGKYTDTEDSTIDSDYEKNQSGIYFGDDTEGAVYQLLWDLHDAENEPNSRTSGKVPGLKDRTALGVPALWTILKGSKVESISDFWKTGFLPGKNLTSFLPGAGLPITNSSSSALAKALDAAETFAEFGVAPLLSKPAPGSTLVLQPPTPAARPKFEWSQEATTSNNSNPSAGAHPDLKLNKFQLVLYTRDLAIELFHKANLTGNSFSLTDADLSALRTTIEQLRAGGKTIDGVRAVIIGESTTKLPVTGPYLSNGIDLGL